jgi:hypothetical protein
MESTPKDHRGKRHFCGSEGTGVGLPILFIADDKSW